MYAYGSATALLIHTYARKLPYEYTQPNGVLEP